MEPARRALLERIMAALASGDRAFVFTLLEHFGDELRATVRRHVASLERRDVLADQTELDSLVTDAAFVIAHHAPGWNPDGAPPWIWAERAIRADVVRSVGHRNAGSECDLESEVSPTAVFGGADLGLDGLTHLRPDDERPQLLVELLNEMVSARNAEVFFEYRLQSRLGDPSPSHTVADQFGLTPANVRQIHHRTFRKVLAALDTDPYRSLAEFPLLVA